MLAGRSAGVEALGAEQGAVWVPAGTSGRENPFAVVEAARTTLPSRSRAWTPARGYTPGMHFAGPLDGWKQSTSPMSWHSTDTSEPSAHTLSRLPSQVSTNEAGLHSVPAAVHGSVEGAPAAQRVADPVFAQSTVASAPPEQ